MPEQLEITTNGSGAYAVSQGKASAAEIAGAGTADLRTAAVAKVGAIVCSPEDGRRFLGKLSDARLFLRNLGRLPLGLDEATIEALSAIDELQAAQVQNIMADQGLRRRFGDERKRVARSYLFDDLHAGIVREVLGNSRINSD